MSDQLKDCLDPDYSPDYSWYEPTVNNTVAYYDVKFVFPEQPRKAYYDFANDKFVFPEQPHKLPDVNLELRYSAALGRMFLAAGSQIEVGTEILPPSLYDMRDLLYDDEIPSTWEFVTPTPSIPGEHRIGAIMKIGAGEPIRFSRIHNPILVAEGTCKGCIWPGYIQQALQQLQRYRMECQEARLPGGMSAAAYREWRAGRACQEARIRALERPGGR